VDPKYDDGVAANDPRMQRLRMDRERQKKMQRDIALEEIDDNEDRETDADRVRRATQVRVPLRPDPLPPAFDREIYPPPLPRRLHGDVDDDDDDDEDAIRYKRPAPDSAPRLMQTFPFWSLTKPNSPKHGSTRKQKDPAGCWLDVKRLSEESADGYTHVCTYVAPHAP
jgi:hypothetical protein